METTILAITCGVVGAAGSMAYRAFVDKRRRIKLPMMFRRTSHTITLDCKGKTIGQMMQVIHEHSEWFGQNAIEVTVELQEPAILTYKLESDSDLSLFKLRWAGNAEYIYENQK